VDLAQGGGGQRAGFDAGERFGEANAQFVLDDGLDFGKVEGGDVVLEAGEGFDVGDGEEVGAGGEQLADFDEGGSHFFEVRGEVGGLRDALARLVENLAIVLIGFDEFFEA
jgi:hypothetical protein